MRRKEFSITEEYEISQFLSIMSFGFLGTISPEGQPRVTPLNFVYDQGVFYFHGSRAGEKMKHLKSNDTVSFTVAEEYALIPSYFSDEELACPATSYFKSVMAYGNAEVVQHVEEKSHAFTLLMQKLQPEGGYLPIDVSDPRYASRLQGVAVIKLVAEQISAKFKFGQNLSADDRTSVIDGLASRDHVKDTETIKLMQKYCPFEK